MKGTSKALEDKIKELDKEIVKSASSVDIDKDPKLKTAEISTLNDLAKSIRSIIKNSENAKLQHGS